MITVELEIRLNSSQERNRYGVELHYTRSDIDALSADASGTTNFDFEALTGSELNLKKYGQLLFNSLFADEKLLSFFERIYTISQALEAKLRIRLFIASGAEDLHHLRWELLCRSDGSPLLTNENILFSRYISSQDFRPERLRPLYSLRALIVVANPADIEKYEVNGVRLTSINVDEEIERTKTALGDIEAKALNGRITLNNIIDQLREGYDILYLVCHGALIEGEPYLWLEDEKGKVARIEGKEFIIRINELQQRPRLIVLASCESSGINDNANTYQNTLTGLGPGLAEKGIPAVLAMQGKISMKTIEQFMPVFFKEFRKDGYLDLAMTKARGTIRDRYDNWMPVLFMRLKTGRLWWYEPGFGGDDNDDGELRHWPDLLRSIHGNCCTPILGTGLTEYLFGSRREIAQDWAQNYNFPLAHYLRDDLTQVAQFLAVDQSKNFPRLEFIDYLAKELRRRYGADVDLPADASLDKLISKVWDTQNDAAEPHKILARLPLSVYINTNPDDLLTHALTNAEKVPQIGSFDWQGDRGLSSDPDSERTAVYPTDKQPLVYHLFGRFNDLNSIVLTEDNFFEYLIAFGLNRDQIPAVVRRCLTNTSLLFLGFQLDEWNFRVLFRSIMRLAKDGRLDDYSHVAVQIEPTESHNQDIKKARLYFQEYFKKADISIFKGSVEDFTTQLRKRWLEKYNQDLGR